MGVIELVDSCSVSLFSLSLFFLYSVLDSIKSFVIEFFVQEVHLKENMSSRFQAKAMVHPVLRCLYMEISAPFSKVKKKGKKEREKEKPIRTCKPGYLEDHYPVS